MSRASRVHEPLSRQQAYVVLSLGVFAIGWSAILVRWAGTSGMVSAFYRLCFGALVFIPWRFAARRTLPPVTPQARRAAIIAGAVFGADLGFFNTGVMTTSATNATLLGVNAPIFVALGAWLMYRERPTLRFWTGFLLAVCGVIAIVGPDVVLHPALGRGDLFAVIGAVWYGGYLLYVQRSRVGMDSLTFSAWATTIGALCLLPVCLLTGQRMGGFPASSWGALVALTLVTQVIGHLLVAHSMGRLPATSSSIVLLGQAPLTALLAWRSLASAFTSAKS